MINNILIIGKGSVSFRHLSLVKSIFKSAKIYHVGSRNFIKNYKRYLNSFFLITIVANDSPSHIKVVNLINKNSNLIFIEKPISDNFQKAKKLMSKKKIKSKIWVGYNLIFTELFQKISSEIKKKKYGKLISIRSVVGHNIKLWRKKNYKKSVSISKKLGGGVLNELSHEINYLIYLCGNLKLLSSYLSQSTNSKIDAEDSAYLVFKNDRNIIISLIMDYYRNDKVRECYLIFEKATLFADFVSGTLYYISNNKKIKLFKKKMDLENSYKNQWLYVKKMLKSNFNNKNNLKKSLLTLKLIKKIKEN